MLFRRAPVCHRQAWLNEKFSPELLENRSEVVECVMEQLTHMVNSPGNTSPPTPTALRDSSTLPTNVNVDTRM